MNKILSYSIILLILFAWWSSLTIGLSSDEYFHHINGLVRYKFLISLGEIQKFEFRNNQFYPGLYDTISYGLGQIVFLINKKLYANNIDVIIHHKDENLVNLFVRRSFSEHLCSWIDDSASRL